MTTHTAENKSNHEVALAIVTEFANRGGASLEEHTTWLVCRITFALECARTEAASDVNAHRDRQEREPADGAPSRSEILSALRNMFGKGYGRIDGHGDCKGYAAGRHSCGLCAANDLIRKAGENWKGARVTLAVQSCRSGAGKGGGE